MFDLTLKPYKMDLTGRGFKLYFNDPLPKDFDSWFILCELPGNSSSINAASHNRMYCDEYHTYFYLGRTAMMVVVPFSVELDLTSVFYQQFNRPHAYKY